MNFWGFFLVAVVYLGFVAVLFYLKVRKRNSGLPGVAAADVELGSKVEKLSEPLLVKGNVAGKVDSTEVIKVKEEKWKDFRITIDPRNLLHPLLLERDDDGGIVIRCVVPDSVLSGPVVSETVPIKTEEEMNLDYMQALSELSESVAEWK